MAKRGGLSREDIEALDQLSARLGSGTYYELLGVSRDASRIEIRTAFFDLSKRFHPDRFFRVDLGPRRAQVDQVFAALSRAYETLARGAVRRMYDAQLDEDAASTNPAAATAEAVAVGESMRMPSPPRAEPAPRAPQQATTPTQPRRRRATGPSQHVLQQLAARVRQREAENAAKHQSVVPPAPTGQSAATALARELMHHASRDQLRLRGYLRSAELAEQEKRWSDAYRFLSLAQRMSPKEVGLIRRMEHAHREFLLSAAPENTEQAKKAESDGEHARAAMLWSRVAEATDDVDALVSAARNYLRCPQPSDQAKAGQLARRAVALAPTHTRANKALLEFFEHAGMERSAQRQREVLQDLK